MKKRMSFLECKSTSLVAAYGPELSQAVSWRIPRLGSARNIASGPAVLTTQPPKKKADVSAGLEGEREPCAGGWVGAQQTLKLGGRTAFPEPSRGRKGAPLNRKGV